MTSTTATSTTHELVNAVWQKSSRSGSGSGAGGNCVEVAITTNLVGVRDSQNPAKGFLTFSPTQWWNLIQGIKHEEFDL